MEVNKEVLDTPTVRTFASYPMGILSFQISLVSLGTKSEISVAMYPGEMLFARANPTHSTARDRTGERQGSAWHTTARQEQNMQSIGRAYQGE